MIVHHCLFNPGPSSHTTGHAFCSRLLQVNRWVEDEGLGELPTLPSLLGASASQKLMGGRGGEQREGSSRSLGDPGYAAPMSS